MGVSTSFAVAGPKKESYLDYRVFWCYVQHWDLQVELNQTSFSLRSQNTD